MARMEMDCSLKTLNRSLISIPNKGYIFDSLMFKDVFHG